MQVTLAKTAVIRALYRITEKLSSNDAGQGESPSGDLCPMSTKRGSLALRRTKFKSEPEWEAKKIQLEKENCSIDRAWSLLRVREWDPKSLRNWVYIWFCFYEKLLIRVSEEWNEWPGLSLTRVRYSFVFLLSFHGMGKQLSVISAGIFLCSIGSPWSGLCLITMFPCVAANRRLWILLGWILICAVLMSLSYISNKNLRGLNNSMLNRTECLVINKMASEISG